MGANLDRLDFVIRNWRFGAQRQHRQRRRVRAAADAPALQPAAIGALFDVDPTLVKRFSIPSLAVLKISYPRRRPQGAALQRDMHGGQQYVRLLDVECQPAGMQP
jgi:Domain of unknown function (DUF4387)